MSFDDPYGYGALRRMVASQLGMTEASLLAAYDCSDESLFRRRQEAERAGREVRAEDLVDDEPGECGLRTHLSDDEIAIEVAAMNAVGFVRVARQIECRAGVTLDQFQQAWGTVQRLALVDRDRCIIATAGASHGL